jgi:SAM-dependent methyltransferase
MHTAVQQYICEMLGSYGQPDSVVEIGSYDVNGSIRPRFTKALERHAYLGLDIRAGPGVDLVCDGAHYRPVKAVECVICCEVLEHAPNARAIVKNALRILRPGGLLVLTCAGEPRRPHGADGLGLAPGEHYANLTPVDLDRWLRKETLSHAVRHNQVLGDLYAWAIK